MVHGGGGSRQPPNVRGTGEAGAGGGAGGEMGGGSAVARTWHEKRLHVAVHAVTESRSRSRTCMVHGAGSDSERDSRPRAPVKTFHPHWPWLPRASCCARCCGRARAASSASWPQKDASCICQKAEDSALAVWSASEPSRAAKRPTRPTITTGTSYFIEF